MSQERYWSARMGLVEWTADDKAEVEARKAEIRAMKLTPPDIITYYSRTSDAVYRACGNGARRGGFGVSRGE